MNKLLMWAVLCTACTGFSMDHLPCDQYPPSPGKTLSDEDLKALLLVTRSGSPEEPRSASSSPIPEDPSQEQITVPAAASPELVQNMHDFQTQFKQWIDTENVAAFRGFLNEHYDDAEEYVSDELVALALQKAANQSEKSQEIYGLLNHLNFGRKNNLGEMKKENPFINNSEKTWHHAQDSQGGVCKADMLVSDHCACAPQVAKYVNHEILKTAEIMRDRTAELQELLYDEREHKLARNAHAIWQKLHQVVYNPCPVTYILSDEEKNGPVYSNGQLDVQIVQNHVKNAFSFSTLESIVGSEKAEKIVLLLSQEKKEKKRGELDWVSPESSPSDGLREYLGSFKALTLD